MKMRSTFETAKIAHFVLDALKH